MLAFKSQAFDNDLQVGATHQLDPIGATHRNHLTAEITGICLLAFRALKQGEQGTDPEPKPRGRYLLAFKSQAFDNDLQVGATHQLDPQAC